MSRNKLAKILTILFGLVALLNFSWHVYLYRGDIFTKFNSAYWTQRYNESQWVVPNSKNSIGDDGLYIYAGYRYMQGDDPSLLNAELPPLGKYLVGFFEITTGYVGIFSVFFSFFALVLLYIFNRVVFKSSLLAILPVMLFSFEPLFIEQIRAPYLDMVYLCFLLLGFIFFLKKKYILTGIALGAFMAIKSPFLVIVVYGAMFVWLLLARQLSFKKSLAMVLPAAGVFFLSYIAIFSHGHNLLYFFKVQKYIVHFYSSGAKAVLGAVFPMLLNGTWYTWFGPMQKVGEWTYAWSISFVGAVIALVIWFRKSNSAMLFQLLWVVLYLIFLCITPLFARYLLLLLPFLYNLSIWALSVAIKPKSFLALD